MLLVKVDTAASWAQCGVTAEATQGIAHAHLGYIKFLLWNKLFIAKDVYRIYEQFKMYNYNRKISTQVQLANLKREHCQFLWRRLGEPPQWWEISCSVISDFVDPIKPAKLLCPWDSPGKNIEVGRHSFSRGSWPKNQTWVSCTAYRDFIDWATREASMVSLSYFQR